MIENIISWLIFGLIVGVIVHLLDSSDVRGGVVGTTLTGLVGSLLGGFLSNTFLHIPLTGFNLESFIIAVAGALLLVVIQRVLFRNQGHIKTRRIYVG